MNNDIHHKAMSTLVEHALLHLHMQLHCEKRFVPVERRNQILLKYMKPKVKSFQGIKSDLKMLLAFGKKKGNLEAKLWQLNQIHLKMDKQSTDADTLYSLLLWLHDEHGVASKLCDDIEEFEANILYMPQRSIDEGFNNQNEQIRPLPFFVKTDSPNMLIEAINSDSRYQAHLTHQEGEFAHFELARLPAPSLETKSP